MTAYVFIGVGAVLYIVTSALLFKDCYRGYGSTMGGEMLAGGLWALGSLFFAPGICLASGISLLWAVPSAAVLYLAGLLCRKAVVRLGSKYGRLPPSRQSSGFAEITVFLISKGAKVNAKDQSGWTPLHWALTHILIPSKVPLQIRSSHQERLVHATIYPLI